MLMSHVDKRHVTSLNGVILRQTGVMRNMSQILWGQKRQRHATLPTKTWTQNQYEFSLNGPARVTDAPQTEQPLADRTGSY